MGIQPDILVCRSELPWTAASKTRIAHFCNVPKHHVLQNLDVDVLYEVPCNGKAPGPVSLNAWICLSRT